MNWDSQLTKNDKKTVAGGGRNLGICAEETRNICKQCLWKR